MSAVYCLYSMLILLLFLPKECSPAQEATPVYIGWDPDTIMDMEANLYLDLKQKAQSVMFIRSKFKRQLPYYVGQSAFAMRTLYMRLLRLNNRWKQDMNKDIVEAREMIRNLTTCQKLYSSIVIMTNNFQEYETMLRNARKGEETYTGTVEGVETTTTQNEG